MVVMERKNHNLTLYTDFNKFRRHIPKEHQKKLERGYVFGYTNFSNRHRRTIKTVINLPDAFYDNQEGFGHYAKGYNENQLVRDCVRFLNHESLHAEIMQQISRSHPEWVVRKLNGDPNESD